MQNVPAPFPQYAQVANATFLLSDYTKENGALCFTPGSHRLCRAPKGESERNPIDNPLVVPVEAPAGSLVVWHGNTWHGAYPRENPGLRMNLIMYFCRVYIREQEPYFQHLDQKVVETLPERLRTLLGEREPLGWREEGPQFERFISRAGASLHG
jgi:ectoine hydroxylase-related dioxygenase (phytanoyl-CoA dioxygenase family)